MDTVFIDTSVFVSENFLEGKRIREIFRLAEEKHLQLVLPIITYKELFSRIRKNTLDALNSYKSFRDKTKIIRNIPEFAQRFDKLDEETCILELQKLFDEKIKSIGTIIIDYPTLNIGETFEKYFANEFPFNSGDKKHEFPDAFAVRTLEEWSQGTGKKCIAISGDKDITQYESKYLRIVPSIADYLDEKLRRIEIEQKRQKRIETATALYDNKKEKFEKQIEQWLVEQLDNGRTYHKHTHYEIHGIDIQAAEAELGDFQVTSISDYEILLSAEAYLWIEVELEIDDFSSGYFDDEAREWIYTDTENEHLEKERKIPVSFKLDIPLAGDEYMDVEILEINNGDDFEI